MTGNPAKATNPSFDEQVTALGADWAANERWAGLTRDYTAADVVRLRGSVTPELTLARQGSAKLWHRLQTMDYVHALGAMTGGQAIQYAKAGLPAIYLSGWQVAGDANLSGHVYPDQSLYPSNSVPSVVARINNALRARGSGSNGPETSGSPDVDYLLPIVADAEAGFGGPLNAFELMKSMIEAGAAGVHWEDQLSSAKKCGHMGGKVLIPTQQHISTLSAARLAADVVGVDTIIVARTDALGANLITSDVDERDREFLTGDRSSEGFFYTEPGMATPIKRSLAYAPYCDLIWCGDLNTRSQRSTAVRRSNPRGVFPTSCWPTTARRRSTGPQPSMTRRSPSSKRSWAQWAMHSSSSRSPDGMPSTPRPSSWRRATTLQTCRPMSHCSNVNSAWKARATRPHATNARSGRATSMMWQR